MKILLDECINRRFARGFSEYSQFEVTTVPEMGWSGVKNGKLLGLAAQNFDVFITVDRNMQYEQNLSNFDLVILVLVTFSNRLSDLQPLLPQIIDTLKNPDKGKAVLIQAEQN